MEAFAPCKVVGKACLHRSHSGLSASSSCAPLGCATGFSGRFSSSCWSLKFSNSVALEMLLARVAQSSLLCRPGNVLPPRPRAQKRLNSVLRFRKDEIDYCGNWRRQMAPMAKFQRFDDFSTSTNDFPGEHCGLDVGRMWDPLQPRRIVDERETIGGVDLFQDCTLSIIRKTCFAAVSAYQPQVQVPAVQRSHVPNYLAGGVLLSIGAWILWVITKTEQYARKALVSPEETLVTPPPAPEMVEQYERAKASVAQAALVNEALAAVRTNDLIKCTVEMELALEENRVARTSIESDFFDEGELLQVYRGVLKVWLDGYPLDYGKILQLRGLLDIPSKEAEGIEQAVQQQSDTYVI